MKLYDIDLSRLTRYPIKERRNKVAVADFAPPPDNGKQSANILDNFPGILTAKDLRDVINHVVNAKQNGRAVIFAIGGHVIKCGLGNIIAHLIECGILDAIIMNGAASIHDFEIAMIGETSEDVSSVLGEGEFGMAKETGVMHNEAVNFAYKNSVGLGHSLGRYIIENNFSYSKNSILAAAYRKQIPIIVSVAIGTDITHMHPEASGAAIGASSHRDFLTLTSILPNLSCGGVYFNIGSAVILPEVFLKAFSIVQNLGYDMDGLITVNMDMQSQYRSLTNVVKRPTDRRGKGYNLIGTHEIMVPLLAYGIIHKLEEITNNE